MKLTATVVWSMGLNLEVPDSATEEQQKQAILNAAMKSELDFTHPIIHDCSTPNLIDQELRRNYAKTANEVENDRMRSSSSDARPTANWVR